MSRDLTHVRFPRGRYVHLLSFLSYEATVCHRVMAFHRPGAIPTTKAVTCPKCLEIGERMRWA